MKTIFFTLFFSLLLSGCKKESENTDSPFAATDLSKPVDSATLKKYHYDTVTFKPIDLTALNLKVGSIHYDASVPTVIWALTIELYDSVVPSKRLFFSVQDRHNNSDSLIKPGLHLATGEVSDAITNLLQNSGFALNSIKSDELEIYFNDLAVTPNNNLSAKGYIQIKKEIYWQWPAGIWNGIKYIYPGDHDYLDYCIPIYYLPVKIYFNTMGKSRNP